MNAGSKGNIMAAYRDTDDILREIGDSLAEEVQEEMGYYEPQTPSVADFLEEAGSGSGITSRALDDEDEDEEPESYEVPVQQQRVAMTDDLRKKRSAYEEWLDEEKKVKEKERSTGQAVKPEKKKKKHSVIKVLTIILLLLIGSGVFLTMTRPGRKILVRIATEYAYSKMEHGDKTEDGTGGKTDGNAVDGQTGDGTEVILNGDGVLTENIDLSQMSETFRNAKHEDGVINILLLGVEAIGTGSIERGHTDAIMIATINTNTNGLVLTSLMRDSYVNIPGYGNDRINAAFAKGGVQLMYETIAQDYNLRLDGYALVGFDAFEDVIDAIGGVDIELTADEAYYLNHTNYISKKANRTMVTGVNHMNGNQALGYCRVRKIATLDGSAYDMGRTSRHRRVMNAIFDKVKTSNPMNVVNVMNAILPNIRTDVTKNNAGIYLSEMLELALDGTPLTSMRLPRDGHYQAPTIDGKSVITLDWDDVNDAVDTVIFGHVQETTTEE